MKESDELRWPDAGTPTFVISKSWLEGYKEYIFYNAIKYDRAPEAEPDHLEKKNPGKILNADIMHLEDEYLTGTGKLKEFPAEMYDTYLHGKRAEGTHYEFITE
jgi:hypothetical protein